MKPIRMSTLGKLVWLLVIFVFIVIISFMISLFKKEKDYQKVEPVSKDEEKVVNYTSTKSTIINFDEVLQVDSKDDVITLTESETYKLSGNNDKYKFVIDAPNKVVKIMFSNFNTSILNNFIEVKAASKVILEMAENTKNEFKAIEVDSDLTEEDDSKKSNIYIINSKVDIEIVGSGSAIVETDFNFLMAEGNLDYSGPIVELNSTNNAIDVKGNVNVNGGVLYINSDSTAIKCNGNFTFADGKIIVKTLEKPIDISGVFLINKGEILLAGGSEFQVPNANSLQKTLILNFEQGTNKSLVLHDTQKVIMAYAGGKEYQHLLYSRSDLDASNYVLYAGGSISGTKKYDLYEKVDDYLEDYQLTSPDFTNSTFAVPDLITIYNGIVKK